MKPLAEKRNHIENCIMIINGIIISASLTITPLELQRAVLTRLAMCFDDNDVPSLRSNQMPLGR